MWIFYVLLLTSALIFSLQFLITRSYERLNGTKFIDSVKLSLFAYFTIAVFFFVKGCIANGGINFGFSWFTFLMTLLVAVVSLTCVVMGIRVLSVGDMSIYSMFMMLGSMMLPTLVGLIFYHESINLIKGIALVLMFLSIVLTVSGGDKSKFKGKALFYYFGVFLMNGLIGVFFTIHQNHPELTAGKKLIEGVYTLDNDVFMTWYGLSTVILCLAVYLVTFFVNKPNRVAVTPSENGQTAEKSASGLKVLALSIGLAVLYGICNGLGDYFIALGTAPGALGASVTFPIVDGGTIMFSTLIGFILYKEKLSVTTIISLILVLASTVLFMYV